MAQSPYDTDLDRNPANFQPLTPLTLLERAAAVFPISLRSCTARCGEATGSSTPARAGSPRRSQSAASAAATRCRRCSPTRRRCWNATTACRWRARVLNTINTRLDAAMIAFMLDHAEAKVLITDREFSKRGEGGAGAVPRRSRWSSTTTIPEFTGDGERLWHIEYEDFIDDGDAEFAWAMPDDEWDAISLNYTSGTTGDPKGVVYHHRGAYLLAVRQRADLLDAQASGLSVDAADVPLQRLVLSRGRSRSSPARMFACAAVRAKAMCDAHRRSQGDASLRRADRDGDHAQRARRRKEAAAAQGRVLHRRGAAARGGAGARWRRRASTSPIVYGLTETYGPPSSTNGTPTGTSCRSPSRRPRRRARACATAARSTRRARSRRRCKPVPRDGETLGEVMFRGNVVMKGYLKNKQGHRGGVRRRLVPFRRSRRDAPRRLHPAQGPLQGHHHLRRREHLIDRGRGCALQASRRCRPPPWWPKADEKWGETPCAFIELKPGQNATSEELVAWCKPAISPATRCRGTSCSPNCRRRAPGRFRSSSCARWRRGCNCVVIPPNGGGQ